MLDDVVQPGDLLGALAPKERGAPLSHFVPVHAPLEDFFPEFSLTVPTSDGAPSLMAGIGKDAEGRKMALVFLERPTYYRLRRPKQTTEEHHVERFVADYQRAMGRRPWDYVRRGSDPPDFVIVDDSGEAGLEVTQFVLPDRVEAHMAFRDVQRAVLARGPENFRQLRGQIVHVGFHVGGPEKAVTRFKAVASEVLEALEVLQPATKPFDPSDPEPPPYEVVEDAVLLAPGQLLTAARGPFYGMMGFEMALLHTTAIYPDDAWARLQNLVTDHDKPGVDKLLVAVGAPLSEGVGFHSDATAIGLAVDAVPPKVDDGHEIPGARSTEPLERPLAAKNIREVLIHGWYGRFIWRIEPGVAELEVLAIGEDPAEGLRELRLTTHDPEGFMRGLRSSVQPGARRREEGDAQERDA